MALFNRFPFSNAHELNLDWILKKIKELETAVSGNTIEPSNSIPADLGTASPGSSEKYSRGDHRHARPTAADVGAVASNQGSANVGKFLVVGNDGDVEPSDTVPAAIQAAVDDYLDGHPTATGTFTNAAKMALLALLEKVAYIDEDGQEYLDTLQTKLFAVEVTSISAVFTQGQAVIYDTDSLDVLKQYLVVTATYSDSSTAVVPGADYALSGTLTEGTSTITAAYGGKTDTFSVTVTHLDLEYVTDGLICRFDGIDNTGAGHNSNVGTWKDLVGSLDLTITGGTWDDDGLVFNQSNSQQAIAASNISASTDMTIEMVFVPTATVTQMVGSFGFRTGLAYRFAIYSDNTIGFRGESGTTYLNSESALTDIKTVAAIYSGASVVKGLVNNTLLSLSNNSHSFTRSSGRPLLLANVDSTDINKYPFKGKIMAVRIYNRALTDSELTKNHQVDIARFNLGA